MNVRQRHFQINDNWEYLLSIEFALWGGNGCVFSRLISNLNVKKKQENSLKKKYEDKLLTMKETKVCFKNYDLDDILVRTFVYQNITHREKKRQGIK